MWLEIILFALTAFLYIYYVTTKQFNFFKEMGVPYSKPSFPFGSAPSARAFMRKIPFTEADDELVAEFPNEKLMGGFVFGQPNFLVNDMELSKRILIKDFEYFMDRRKVETNDKIMASWLTNLDGEEWKRMRALMSGVFTSGRLKLMARHIAKVGENLAEYIGQQADKEAEVDLKELSGYMTMDGILTAGFGIETNSFADPDNIFRKMALTLVGAPGYASKWAIPKTFVIFLMPKLANMLGWTFLDGKAQQFYADVIRKTYKKRVETGERRNDIIDLIIDAKKNFDASKQKAEGEMLVEEELEDQFEKDAALDTSDVKSEDIDKQVDMDTLLVANAMVFFFAGFETTSSGLCVVAIRIANLPDVQDKIIEEIDEVFDSDDAEVTFERIQELKYLDKVVSESLRLNKMVSVIERKCTKDYKVPGTDFVIPKDRYVKIYCNSLTHSSDNFVNPDNFDPENFDVSNNPNKFGLMMFGQGPRNCIGMRYALLTLKIALVNMLLKYRLVKGPNTPEDIVMDTKDPRVFKQKPLVLFERRN